MLTQERLKELLHYDPETGLFTRLKSLGKSKVGNIAGCLNPEGYIQIKINYVLYRAHRLAFLYMTGKLPYDDVDHINGIRHDNKWSNLRECDNSQNMHNRKKAHKNNKSSGLLGVSSSSNGNGTFRATIWLNNKHKQLGTFKTKEEAHERYLEAKRELHEFNTL